MLLPLHSLPVFWYYNRYHKLPAYHTGVVLCMLLASHPLLVPETLVSQLMLCVNGITNYLHIAWAWYHARHWCWYRRGGRQGQAAAPARLQHHRRVDTSPPWLQGSSRRARCSLPYIGSGIDLYEPILYPTYTLFTQL